MHSVECAIKGATLVRFREGYRNTGAREDDRQVFLSGGRIPWEGLRGCGEILELRGRISGGSHRRHGIRARRRQQGVITVEETRVNVVHTRRAEVQKIWIEGRCLVLTLGFRHNRVYRTDFLILSGETLTNLSQRTVDQRLEQLLSYVTLKNYRGRERVLEGLTEFI